MESVCDAHARRYPQTRIHMHSLTNTYRTRAHVHMSFTMLDTIEARECTDIRTHMYIDIIGMICRMVLTRCRLGDLRDLQSLNSLRRAQTKTGPFAKAYYRDAAAAIDREMLGARTTTSV